MQLLKTKSYTTMVKNRSLALLVSDVGISKKPNGFCGQAECMALVYIDRSNKSVYKLQIFENQ